MTKHVPLSLRIAVCLLAIAGLNSCTGSDSGGTAKTGGSTDISSGGSGGTAGVPASTTTGSGGSIATSGGSGGVLPVGGSGGIGGVSLAGGSSSNGGVTSAGGSSGGTTSAGGSRGGATNSGGLSVVGGITGTGGSRATGGTSGTGGSSASGGTTPAGGSSSIGGSSARGGTTAVGGTTTTGGTTNSGGGSGGSKPAGGTTAAGGTTSAGGTTGTGGSTGAGGSTHAGKWNVMMLGNSITGSTCYPQVLSAQLIAGKHTNFQFVGTVTNNQSCGANTPSVKTEGHGGYGVTYLPSTSTRGTCTKQPQGCGSYAELQTWAAEKPDIVLMHFATNDVWDGRATSEILSSFVAVITEFRKNNPDVIFFVSKIIKLNPSGCGSCLTNVAALAAALTPAWASTNSTASSPIYIIDHYDCGFDPNDVPTDTADGVHPTLVGATIMATTSYNAIVASGYF
jgi:hypothetical protein